MLKKLTEFLKSKSKRGGLDNHAPTGAAEPVWLMDEKIMDLGQFYTGNQDALFVPMDYLSPRDLFQSVMILGQQGSGKTSGSMAHIARNILMQRWGGLVLSAKNEEVDNWRNLWASSGRRDELRIFGGDDEGEGMCAINFLDYELKNGSGKGSTGNLVSLLTELANLSRQSANGSNSSTGDFFEKQCSIALSNAVEFLRITTGTVSVPDLHTFFSKLPPDKQFVRSEQWKDSWFGKKINGMRKVISQEQTDDGIIIKTDWDMGKIPADRIEDWKLAIDYITDKWPLLAPETRSSIDMTILNVLDPFLRYPLRQLFCEKTTWNPADTFQKGMVTVVGEKLALKGGGDAERFAQVLLKILVQRAVERQSKERKPDTAIPIFIYTDEGQYFVTRSDLNFLQTARASKCASIFGTQNLGNLYSRIGKQDAEPLLGLYALKIFHQNGDPETNEWASRSIGKELTQLRNNNFSLSECDHGHHKNSMGSGTSYQEIFRVQPFEFQQLRSGGPENEFAVEAIVFRPGRPFPATEKNYGITNFFQN